MITRLSVAFAAIYILTELTALPPRTASAEEPGNSRVPVTFSGGYETVGVDKGRPVKLIAAALGVPDEVFREAFSHVRPAPAGTEPEPRQVQANKAALMKALGPYGVTNDRLDEVSNYYRYRPGKGNLWRHEPASAMAIVKNGAVTGFEITQAGSGYLTPPTVSVPGYPNVAVEVQLGFDQDFSKNGRITAITLKAGHSK